MPGTKFSKEVVEAFKDALVTHASAWQDDIPEYTAASGSEKAYDQMGTHLLSKVLETPVLESVRELGSVESGMEVIPRFMYAGAAKAALRGFTIGQLKTSMYNHASFTALSAITHEPLHVAKRIEIPLGLKVLGSVSVDYALDSFDINEETGLSILEYDRRTFDARIDAYNQGHIEREQLAASNPALCEGQITGINSHAYRAMLTICMNDPNLFQATLSRQTPAS